MSCACFRTCFHGLKKKRARHCRGEDKECRPGGCRTGMSEDYPASASERPKHMSFNCSIRLSPQESRNVEQLLLQTPIVLDTVANRSLALHGRLVEIAIIWLAG